MSVCLFNRSQTRTAHLWSLTLLALATSLTACGTEVAVDTNAPVVVEVDQSEIVVGESLYLYGKNFSERSYQRNLVYFDGQFIDDRGQSEEVSHSFAPLIVGEVERGGQVLQVLRVSRFGLRG